MTSHHMSCICSASRRWLMSLYWNMCCAPFTRSRVSSLPSSAWSLISTPATSSLTLTKTAVSVSGLAGAGATCNKTGYFCVHMFSEQGHLVRLPVPGDVTEH